MTLAREIAAAFADASSWDRSRTVGMEFRAASAAPQEPSGAAGRWFVTPHAVERWKERTGQRRLSYEQALGAIVVESCSSHMVKELASGAQLWRGPKPFRLRYVVVIDGIGLPVLATVLPAFDRR